MKLSRKVGATSQILQIFIADSSSTTGAGLTGLVFNTASLTAYYHKDLDTTATAISLVTMTVGTFTSSGFKEIDATNMPGWYQFCPPNAALSSGASVAFHLKGATNMAPLPIEVDLDTQVDVYLWNGTAVSSPATAGIPDVNAKNINNVATTSVTTINANQGTTQPINFTGTAGSALAKSDMVDIAGSAVSTSTAQLGVNAVNAGGTAWGSGAITAGSIAASALNGKGDWNIGKTGYALSAAGVQAIWDALTSALTTVGSIGKLLVTNIDAAISSRGTSTLTQTQVTGGVYSVQSASCVLGDARIANLDAAISTRLASASYTAPDNTSITAIKTQTDKFVFTVANQVDANVITKSGFALTAAYDLAKTAAQAGDAMTLTAAYDAAKTASTQTSVNAVKTQTDKLTFTVANQIDSNIQYVNDVQVNGNGQAATPWGP